ncbi:MAG: hypothetical protein ACRDUV_07835 [Pseudonocardiaceae bacterium]
MDAMQTTTRIGLGVCVAAATAYQPAVLLPAVAILLILLLVSLLILLLGVVLPAVWSRKDTRCCAAADVLKQILRARRSRL